MENDCSYIMPVHQHIFFVAHMGSCVFKLDVLNFANIVFLLKTCSTWQTTGDNKNFGNEVISDGSINNKFLKRCNKTAVSKLHSNGKPL